MIKIWMPSYLTVIVLGLVLTKFVESFSGYWWVGLAAVWLLSRWRNKKTNNPKLQDVILAIIIIVVLLIAIMFLYWVNTFVK